MLKKIGLGGSCHWCTEAVFQNLKGVARVHQGYVASTKKHISFSEAIIAEYLECDIPLEVLIHVHLLTHKSTSNHSRRDVYRSAIYYYTEEQQKEIFTILKKLQPTFKDPLITLVLPMKQFKYSREEIQNYYNKNPLKPFCTQYIHPKLKRLQKEFGNFVKQ